MNSERIIIIKSWSSFKSYRNVQVFLNFINFYRRFIFDYFIIAMPLINLFKENKNDKKFKLLNWINDVEAIFRQFRETFFKVLFFNHYDLNKKIRLEIDILIFNLKVILSQ